MKAPPRRSVLFIAMVFSTWVGAVDAPVDAAPVAAGSVQDRKGLSFGEYEIYDHIDPAISRYAVSSGPRTDLSEWTDVTTPALACTVFTRDKKGVAFVDYDVDGDLDLCAVGEGEHGIALFRNDSGVFTEVTAGALLLEASGSSQTWGDIDNDGDPDLVFIPEEDRLRLFRNNGDGSFTDITPESMLEFAHGHSSSWADFDRDGLLDLYVANLGRIASTPSRLFHQESPGVFVDASTDSLGVLFGDGVAAGDLDNDGDADLFLARFSNKQDLLLRNDDGTFVDITGSAMLDALHGHSCAAADFDNDLDLDVFVANANGPNRLYRNEGGGSFVQATPPALVIGIHSVGMSWGDFDNDGLQDLFVTLTDEGQSRMFHNDGGGEFSEVAAGPLVGMGTSAGSACGDYDQDGDLDLYVSSYQRRASQLFRNDLANGNRWLQIDLEGTVSNRSAIGARIHIEAGGQWQMREIMGCTGFRSQSAMTAHFGLGSTSLVERIRVLWPSGVVQETTLVVADQRIRLVESGTVNLVGDPVAQLALLDAAPNPFAGRTRLSYSLPAPATVRLDVLDLAGRVVRTLEDDAERTAGRHERVWDARDDAGRRVAEGVYFLRLTTPWGASRRRLVAFGR